VYVKIESINRYDGVFTSNGEAVQNMCNVQPVGWRTTTLEQGWKRAKYTPAVHWYGGTSGSWPSSSELPYSVFRNDIIVLVPKV
jgi:hypothetical protein